jgi:hypothetical protein
MRDTIVHEMGLSIQNELETVYGQIVSFSLTNVTMQESLDKILIAQQVSKSNIQTSQQLKKIQEIQGEINKIRKQAEIEEENLLRDAKKYYTMEARIATLIINKERALNELEIIKNDITGYFFSKQKLNKFYFYKKVNEHIINIGI